MDDPNAAEPVVEAEPAAAAPVVTPPAPAPWAADIAERFTDETTRTAVDAYLREKQQPYITKLEQDAAALRDKSWVFDGLNSDNPLDTLTDIVSQVYGGEAATRIVELLSAGETPADAAAIAKAEAEAGEPTLDLAKLPPEVREAVEFAQAAKAQQAADTAAKVEADALAEATTLYDTWRGDLLKTQPDIKENVLHAFVFAAEGDMEQGLANYRAEFPAPAAEKPEAKPTLTGGASNGLSTRRLSSLADAFGDVFDAAAGTRTI